MNDNNPVTDQQPLAQSARREFIGANGVRAIIQYDFFPKSADSPHQLRYTPVDDDMPSVIRMLSLKAARKTWAKLERELKGMGMEVVETVREGVVMRANADATQAAGKAVTS